MGQGDSGAEAAAAAAAAKGDHLYRGTDTGARAPAVDQGAADGGAGGGGAALPFLPPSSSKDVDGDSSPQQRQQAAGMSAPPLSSGQAAWLKPLLYAALNIASASGIVFANKMVFQTFGFRFTVALTWVHTAVTWVGMRAMQRAGMFPVKVLPPARVAPLAAAFVGYIVLCNLSLNLNTVGFYQIMKIAVAPTVLVMESAAFRRRPERRVAASVGVVCLGIAIATLTDAQVKANARGAIVGVAATLVTGLYQLWVGTKQRELGASSMQLLHQYTPQATAMMGLLVPIMEPVGWRHVVGSAGGAGSVVGFGGGAEDPSPSAASSLAAQLRGDGTLLGYLYTPSAVAAILFSAALGLLVSLSTFLVIGATSSLTYNVVGHLKTVIILTGGCLLFGDQMPLSKLAGLGVAMGGIVWYSRIKMSPGAASVAPAVGAAAGTAVGGGEGGKKGADDMEAALLPSRGGGGGAGGGGGGGGGDDKSDGNKSS